MNRLFFAALTAALLTCAGRVSATTISTTSFNTWKASLTGSPIELDFTKVKNSTYNTSAGITLLPLQGPALGFLITGPDKTGYSLSGGNFGSVVSLFGAADGVGSIRIDLPSVGENAILLGLAAQPTAGLTVNLSDQESFAVSNGLLGLSLSHTISWLTISTVNGSKPVLDDFYFGVSNLAQDQGAQSQSAEAATAFLIGSGLLILFGARRKFAQRLAA